MKYSIGILLSFLSLQSFASTHTCTDSELRALSQVEDDLAYVIPGTAGNSFVVVSFDGLTSNRELEDSLECERTKAGLEVSVADKVFGFTYVNKTHVQRILSVTLTRNELKLNFEKKAVPFLSIDLKTKALNLQDGRVVPRFQ
ncbi:MAG: hypothetical protein IPM97_13305 [Bdellovibrionaceae bacterium]|nr:hypothetical protein [Pseudobdellovibrionaceae bacterium]